MKQLVPALLFILLASCSTRNTNGVVTDIPTFVTETITPTSLIISSATNSPFPVPTATRKQTERVDHTSTSIITPTVEKMITPTITTPMVTKMVMQKQCVALRPNIPSSVSLHGTLVLDGEFADQGFFLNLETFEKEAMPQHTHFYSASPDGKWMAYEKYSSNKPEPEYWLVLDTANGQQKRQFNNPGDWYLGSQTWLGNNQLMYNVSRNTGLNPIIILNSQSGTIQEFPPDFPGLENSILGMSSGISLFFLNSPFLMDPSLQWVLYPKSAEDGRNFLVVWDRGSQKAVASLEDHDYFYNNPVWYPNGNAFVIAASIETGNTSSKIEELFQISTNGQIFQLTQFGERYGKVDVGMISLSPDGNLLAFWIQVQSEGDKQWVLYVRNMENGKIIDTCIPASAVYGDRPVWSPDSRYVIVGYPLDNEDFSRSILIDTKQNWAITVGDHVYPAGWLLFHPGP
jgi:hypothetical protein